MKAKVWEESGTNRPAYPAYTCRYICRACCRQYHSFMHAALQQERKRRNAGELCINFAKGCCHYGASCRFNHDLAKVMQHKPADLPGSCPFIHAPPCPYGNVLRPTRFRSFTKVLPKCMLYTAYSHSAHAQPLFKSHHSSMHWHASTGTRARSHVHNLPFCQETLCSKQYLLAV